MKPLLAHIYEPHRVTYPCYVQPKLNGVRALYQGGRFQSRDQLPFPEGLLDHLAQPLLRIFGDVHPPLDGELYVHGWPLQRINAAVTPVRQKPTEDTVKVEYHVFDVVDFGARFIDRLTGTIPFTWDLPKGIKLVETRWCDNEIGANVLYADWVAKGYEGMMYRLGDCPYTVPKQPNSANYNGRCWNVAMNQQSRARGFLSDKDNRCWHLLKRKDWQDDEFVCVRPIEGEGKYAGTLGALECVITKIIDGESRIMARFSVGSGLTDSERDLYWKEPDRVVGHLVKVKYLVLSSDGIPLNPTILAVL